LRIEKTARKFHGDRKYHKEGELWWAGYALGFRKSLGGDLFKNPLFSFSKKEVSHRAAKITKKGAMVGNLVRARLLETTWRRCIREFGLYLFTRNFSRRPQRSRRREYK
jgi:hypothetical protein